MTTTKTKPDWAEGRGTDDLEESISATTTAIVNDEDSGETIVTATPATPTGASHKARLIAEIVKASPSAIGKGASLRLRDLAASAGVTLAFTRIFVRDGLAEELTAIGLNMTDNTSAQIIVERVSAAPAGSPAGAATAPKKGKVRAASAKAAAAAADPATLDPDYFYFDPMIKKKLTVAANAKLNVWAVGPTGCGKSEYFERILQELSMGFIKVSFNGDSSSDDLLGFAQLVPNEEKTASITKIFYGALRKAMEDGLILICEEIDAAPAECNLAMQRALERRSGQGRKFYDTLSQEEVEAADGFCVWATANTAGGGDHTGIYVGTQLQNAAFRDRFVFEEFDYLPELEEVKVLTTRTGLPPELAQQAVHLATAARNEVKVGNLVTPVSTRGLCQFAELERLYAQARIPKAERIREAFRSSVLIKCGNPTDREALAQMAQRVFGFRSA